ncbi:peptide chain release factor [Clostridium cavendishii DSM 21758]|uniref:Peptide chain release factor n=1 Tax=Clostridium cavendishii DSM 21758 TaxID=1121302 RepID=A0A1M6CAK3_9CLOT|nr:peptide chain release factor H [Clostridium cavendishii]SHI57738.1 peptide chain release factor [Clostridium cavendishii DSM 21758]
MKLQISSSSGPLECEVAVKKFLESILVEFKNIEILETTLGENKVGYKSVIIHSDEDLSDIKGTIKWICESPYRKEHKRKNWFIDVSEIEVLERHEIDESLIKYETFRVSGNGGQNVNKVETGVRVIYEPLGIVAEAREERSQIMNRKKAIKRLYEFLENKNKELARRESKISWQENRDIIRGNPIRIYKGVDFKRYKGK